MTPQLTISPRTINRRRIVQGTGAALVAASTSWASPGSTAAAMITSSLNTSKEITMPLHAAPTLQVSQDDARTIASEAYIFAYAMLYGYKTLFTQTIDPSFPGYIGGFNRYRHYSRTVSPVDTDIVTPNNDTPYSWAWLDLRTEPIVLTVPEVAADRYYVMQWFDLYTHNFTYVGTRATGNGAGNYLFTPPGWDGDVPAGIAEVFPTETEFIGTLTRTEIKDAEKQDAEPLKAIQRQYRFTPLSEFAGTRPPFPAPQYLFPAWDEARAASPDFISYLNFILQFCPPIESEAEMMSRFAEIGIGPGVPFDAGSLDAEVRQAIADGVAEGLQQINDEMAATTSSADLFGTREFLGADYAMMRAVGAALGIYGNSKEEAYYVPYERDADGQPLDGGKQYELRFVADQIPPAQYFWSMTMYNLPARLLVENPIDRYSIGNRTAGLTTEADGSLVIYLQSESPGADKEGNWLPTPAGGSFYAVLRIYGPDETVLDGAWQAPAIELVS